MVLLKRRCLRLVVGGDPVNEGCNLIFFLNVHFNQYLSIINEKLFN